MSASERLKFEQQMSEDAHLREDVLLQKSIVETLFNKEVSHVTNELQETKIAEVKQTLKSASYQEHQQHLASISQVYEKGKQQKRRWFIGSAAAILLLLSSLFWFPSEPSYDALYAEYADWSEMTSYIEQNDSNDFAQGELLYREQKYAEAVAFFENFTENSNQKLYAPGLIYLGASYVGNNQLNKALDAFEKLIQSKSFDRSKGYWYQLLVYLKQENTEKIQSTLELILKNPSNFNYKKAFEIKDALEN
jgi:tetratricopeptide (TPR) repeat protein